MQSGTGWTIQAFRARSDKTKSCFAEITVAQTEQSKDEGVSFGTVIIKNFLVAVIPEFWSDITKPAADNLFDELKEMHGADGNVLKNISKFVMYTTGVDIENWEGDRRAAAHLTLQGEGVGVGARAGGHREGAFPPRAQLTYVSGVEQLLGPQ